MTNINKSCNIFFLYIILKFWGRSLKPSRVSETYSAVKVFACNAGDAGDFGSIPGLGRSPREVNGNPLQYSSLENPMNRGAWRGRKESEAIEHCTLAPYATGFDTPP